MSRFLGLYIGSGEAVCARALHSRASISYLITRVKPDGMDNYLQPGNMLLVISGILHSSLGPLV